ncbi:hypothetical protein R3W88_005842 [Solanum pinnatisectum]|uniref:Receptor-like serine/threonine-protein kinase n=1 Tax=Solanum pinnatisectum TaxID=50273 RepID=A0AAV9KDJ7_9SOLN|nr:hypothetical protein R3W88_005842 [Solanum pinnatisectum]
MSSLLSCVFAICHLLIFIALFTSYGAAQDTLLQNQFLINGMTLVSSGQIFELRFVCYFSIPICKMYLRLWYKDVGPGTVVWVGNRRNPVNCGALLGLDTEGDIFLQDILGTTEWIHKPNKTVPLPVLKLLDSGNLVLGDSSNLTAGEYLWQSFDHPVDTLLPGMKLGWDKKTGIDRSMRSWRTSLDPAPGDYLFRLDSGDSGQLPQLLLEKNQRVHSRWGPWDGQKFSGGSALMDNHAFRPIFHSDTNAIFFTFEAKNDWSLKLSLNQDGKRQFLRWNYAANYWEEVNTLNKDTCDQYSTCGPYGVCTDGDLPCGCPNGFTAASPDEWGKMNFMEGCRRNTSLNYTNKDVFVENTGLKLPDNATYWGMLYPQECEQKCLNERSCMAYTNISINGNGSKCVVWLGDLLDRRHSQMAGNNIFIQMAPGKLDAPVSDSRWENEWTVFASLISELAILIILLIAVVVLYEPEINQPTNSQGALLQDTNVIAYDSIKLIAKLQHRNLTKLLGYCINGAEKFLVYEFMENNSLDKVIFDPARRGTVTWPMSFNIIKGIAKGLVYMHHDSRLTIIHRDLKASNVLLDREMTPKISDLGLSRVFEDDVEEKTQHLIGTRGYMPPEYMKNGHYSTKADVFSFGILALEIVSGQKNYDYRHPVYDIGLVDYAWRIWSKGNAIELLDPMIEKPGDENEVLGCILVGLLCCQRRAQDRPSMIQVVSLLEKNEMSRLNFVPQEPYYSKELSRGAGVVTE